MDDQADDFAGMPGFEELGLDPDEWLWVRGVDYLSGWRAGREQAQRLNAALAAAGIAREELRAVAATGADGRGRVRSLGFVDDICKVFEAPGLPDEPV